jgi:hypothetical protein
MKPKPKANNQRGRLLIILVVVVILCILVVTVIRQLSGSSNPNVTYKHSDKIEYFQPYEKLSGFPQKDYPTTDKQGVSVSWQDSRPGDGNLSCTIYQTDSKKIIAFYSSSSGYNPEGKIYTEITIESNILSLSAIDSLIEQYCTK